MPGRSCVFTEQAEKTIKEAVASGQYTKEDILKASMIAGLIFFYEDLRDEEGKPSVCRGVQNAKMPKCQNAKMSKRKM